MWKGIPESELLVEQLCRVDKYKRLDGIVNELAFDLHLHKSILRAGDQIAFGWCSESLFGRPTDYYKVVPADMNLCDADVEFLRRRQDGQARFFYVVLDRKQSPSVGNLEFTVSSARLEDGELEVCHDLRAEKKLKELISVGRGSELHKGLSQADRQKLASHISFLSSFDPVILKDILLRRMFLNFYLRYATDIDAVLYNRFDKTVDIIEFKRKTPIPGLWLNVSGEKISAYGVEAVKKLEGKLKVRADASRQDIKSFLQRALVTEFGEGNVIGVVNNEKGLKKWPGAHYARHDCVGLDLSHSRNVVMAEQFNMRYRYVLLLEDVVDPGFYFESDYSLKDGIHLKERYIVLRSARGFTYTVGKDSGSYTKQIRVQLVWKV